MKKNIRLILAIAMAALIAVSVTVSILVTNGTLMSGNNSKYSASKSEKVEDSTLTDETIIFVGSNLLSGSKAGGDSFVEYLENSDGIKSAVYCGNDAVLVERGKNSLVSFVKSIPTENANPRMLLCEVPYADATDGSKIGTITDGYYDNEYKTNTVIGAMEYIISYSEDTWGCPVVFYTCQPNDNKHYAKIMDAVYQVADKWNVEVLDFYNDPLMALDDQQKKLYMATESNPTKAGYKELYTPKFREFLLQKIY